MLFRSAGSRLAALARSGRPQLAAADPAQWWGMRPVTVIDTQSSSAPVLSGTAIEEIEKCPARWFLERQVRAEAVKESPLVFGNALHKIAEGLASQSIEPHIEQIDALLDRMWPGMSYDAVWESKMQRSAAHDASVRLLAWFLEHSRFEAHVEARSEEHTSELQSH